LSVPLHVAVHDLPVANHTPISEDPGAAALRNSLKKKHDAEMHVAVARKAMEKATAVERVVSTKIAETRRPATAAAGKHGFKATDSPTAAAQKAAPTQQKVSAKKVAPPKDIVDLPKATPVQQPKPVTSTAKKSPSLVKALHQAASVVKVATEVQKSETEGQKGATELDEAGTEQETKGEQKEEASEAVTANARRKEEEVVRLADGVDSDGQGSDEVTDNEGQDESQDESQSKQENQGQHEGAGREESQNQDDSEVQGKTEAGTQADGDDTQASTESQGEDNDKGSEEQVSEHNLLNNENEGTAPASENDDN